MDWSLFLADFGRLLAAFALALPIGWERQRASRSAGLRTFPLVAAASCAYALIVRTFDGATAETQSRLLQGLITGIGFIGGGAILKSGERVHGTATAAGIWITGAIGAAAGFGRWEMAIAMSLITYVALGVLTRVERRLLDHDRDAGVSGQSPVDPD